MTFVHFLNCMALAYAPYVVTYKTSILSEYSSYSRLLFAGLVYMLTQLGKMLILATFFPAVDLNADLNIPAEFMKCLVDVVDLFGIYFLINQTVGKPDLKVLTTGVGWAGAETLFTKLLMFWFGARGMEFDWKFIRAAIDCNITLVHVVSVSALVWAYTRTDLNKNLLPMVTSLLAMSIFRNLLVDILVQALSLTSWYVIALRGCYTFAISTVALQIYVGLYTHD